MHLNLHSGFIETSAGNNNTHDGSLIYIYFSRLEIEIQLIFEIEIFFSSYNIDFLS